jgi:single-stranded DNA-binding protein
MRVVVTGRLTVRNYEYNGERRTSLEMQVDEIGPSLRYARAQVTKVTGGGGNFGGGGNYGNSYQGGGGGYGGRASYDAPQGGSAHDPWQSAPQGGSAFDDNPPF